MSDAFETRAAALREAVSRLAVAGALDPAREARLLMRWATGLDAAALSTRLDQTMADAEAARFRAGVIRRTARAPLSHITGRRAFWGRDFIVTPDVLDPRPETEILVGWALEGRPPRRILDLGVGSGCILLTLLAEWPDSTGLGVDASAAALSVTQRNAAALGVAERMTLLRADWLEAIEERFDLIVANPPYLTTDAMQALSPEVRAEPPQALAAGADGLDAYRRILPGLAMALNPGGAALLEIGPGQAPALERLAAASDLSLAATREDLDGRVRVLRFSPESAT